MASALNSMSSSIRLIGDISLEEHSKFQTFNSQAKNSWVGIALCAGALFGVAILAGGAFLTGPASYAAIITGGGLSLLGIPGIILIVKNCRKPSDQASLSVSQVSGNRDTQAAAPTLNPKSAQHSYQASQNSFGGSKELSLVGTTFENEIEKQEAKELLKSMLEDIRKITQKQISENPHLFPKGKFEVEDFTKFNVELFHKIAKDGSAPLLEIFLELKKEEYSENNYINCESVKFLYSPLNLAIGSGDLVKVKILLQNGADPKDGRLWNNPPARYHSIMAGTKEIITYFLEEGIIDEVGIIEVLKATGDISSDIYSLLLTKIPKEINLAPMRDIFFKLFDYPGLLVEPLKRIENFQLFYDKWNSHEHFGMFLNREISNENLTVFLRPQSTELFLLTQYALVFSRSIENINTIVTYAKINHDLMTLEILFNHPNFFSFLAKNPEQEAKIKEILNEDLPRESLNFEDIPNENLTFDHIQHENQKQQGHQFVNKANSELEKALQPSEITSFGANKDGAAAAIIENEDN